MCLWRPGTLCKSLNDTIYSLIRNKWQKKTRSVTVKHSTQFYWLTSKFASCWSSNCFKWELRKNLSLSLSKPISIYKVNIVRLSANCVCVYLKREKTVYFSQNVSTKIIKITEECGRRFEHYRKEYFLYHFIFQRPLSKYILFKNTRMSTITTLALSFHVEKPMIIITLLQAKQ